MDNTLTVEVASVSLPPVPPAAVTLDAVTAQDNYFGFRRAYDAGHEAYLNQARTCNKFYCGDQWRSEDLAKLKKEKRPALTINKVLTTINTIYGEYAQRRAEFQYKPRRDGATQDVASTLTQVVMQITSDQSYDTKEGQVFLDGLIMGGRGYFDIRMCFEENTQGEIIIEQENPEEVIPDPFANSYDPAKWNEVSLLRWKSVDDIEVLYGKSKADALRFNITNGTVLGMDNLKLEDRPTFGDLSRAIIYQDGSATTAQTVSALRVIERQVYRIGRVREFVNLEFGDASPVPDSWDELRVQAFAQQYGLFLRSRITKRIRWTVSCDNVVLHDEWSPYKTLTIVPYFAYFRRGKTFGAVDNLLSPQEQLNKAESQILHVVNTTANSGYFVPTGSLTNMSPQELEVNGAKTGLVIEYAPNAGIPTKIQPNQVPTGLDRVALGANAHIYDISGVNQAMTGAAPTEISGVALENKQLRGQIPLQLLFDNMVETRRIVARKLLELIQGFYTEQRVLHITTEPGTDPKAITINERNAAGEIVNDLTLGVYEVAVSSMPARDVFNDSQFAEAIGLQKAGVPIPPWWMVRYSNLHKKDELAQELQQRAGAMEPTPHDIAKQQLMEELQLREIDASIRKTDAEAQDLLADMQLKLSKSEGVKTEQLVKMQTLLSQQQTQREELAVRLQVQRLKAANMQAVQAADHNYKLQEHLLTPLTQGNRQ
jgi:hypothetical protein